MDWGLFLWPTAMALAFGMLISGFWEREELPRGVRRAIATGYVLVVIAGGLCVAGVIPELDIVDGVIFITVGISGLTVFITDLPGLTRTSSKAGATVATKHISEVRVSRWEGSAWSVWLPAIVAITAMIVGVVLVTGR